MDIKELQNIIQENGVVGAGGAGFPTYMKLTDKANTILMNCAECEPLLKLHRQLLEKHAYEIMKTFHMVQETVGASEAIIGIKKSYVQTVNALKQHIEEFPGMRIHLLDEVYPMGDEVVLIYEATGRVVRPGGLPIEQGVAVFNVETLYNIYQAVEKKEPVTAKYVSVVETIGGGVVLNPNWVKRKKRQNADAVVHCACTGKERKKAHASGKITEEICGNSVFLQLQELYLKSGFMPPLTDEVKKVFSGERDFSEVFFAMVRDGVLVRFDEKHYMHWEIRQKALDMAYLLYEEKGMIQTGEFRDRLGISRKCAIILLEGFDRERITVMENGGRVLKRNLQQADRSQ